MPFEGNVVVTPVLPKGNTWKVCEDLTYVGRTDTFVVPAGFVTDFASVPRVFTWLLPRYGRWTQAAILHDFLWGLARKGEFNKFDADGIFNRAMRELGVPFLRRWIMWTAVRWAAGPGTWFKRGPAPFLKMLLMTVLTVPFIAVPSLAVLFGLVTGAVAEYVVYLPLKFLHRDKTKDVNQPELGDVLQS